MFDNASTVSKPNWCGGNYTGSGLIYSAAYSDYTQPGLGCYYHLTVPSHQVVRLIFESLSLAEAGGMEVNMLLALAFLNV